MNDLDENHQPNAPSDALEVDEADSLGLLEIGLIVRQCWKRVVVISLAVACSAFGAASLVPPTYTAHTSFLPPQQQQSAAASALASLGALAGIAGGSTASLRSPAEQYAALMKSTRVLDRILERHKLMQAYGFEYRIDARRKLAGDIKIETGKKDGLITVFVDDKDPQRAADIANELVDELRLLTSQLALSEAQQRRAFFEQQLKLTKERLADAQQKLQGSGFNAGNLRAEPRAAADSYARLLAEITAAQVKVQALRQTLVESAPEVQQHMAIISALRQQVAKLEATQAPELQGQNQSSDYVSRYREFKYQESLFELFSRQYEIAKLDESREGALIQVVDKAEKPERKSKPKRAVVALTALAASLFVTLAYFVGKYVWRNTVQAPGTAARIRRFREIQHRA